MCVCMCVWEWVGGVGNIVCIVSLVHRPLVFLILVNTLTCTNIHVHPPHPHTLHITILPPSTPSHSPHHHTPTLHTLTLSTSPHSHPPHPYTLHITTLTPSTVGFLLCHSQLSAPGASDIWKLALQDGYALTLFRDESIPIHSVYEKILGESKAKE